MGGYDLGLRVGLLRMLDVSFADLIRDEAKCYLFTTLDGRLPKYDAIVLPFTIRNDHHQRNF